MARATNKSPSHARTPELRAALESLSKAALIDIIGDALDLLHGEANWKARDACDLARPRLVVRGDRLPPMWAALYPGGVDYREPDGPDWDDPGID